MKRIGRPPPVRVVQLPSSAPDGRAAMPCGQPDVQDVRVMPVLRPAGRWPGRACGPRPPGRGSRRRRPATGPGRCTSSRSVAEVVVYCTRHVRPRWRDRPAVGVQQPLQHGESDLDGVVQVDRRARTSSPTGCPRVRARAATVGHRVRDAHAAPATVDVPQDVVVAGLLRTSRCPASAASERDRPVPGRSWRTQASSSSVRQPSPEQQSEGVRVDRDLLRLELHRRSTIGSS